MEVTKVVFGDNQVDVPPDSGITLADVRAAFGFEDRGILVAPTADGGTRPVATMADEPVPLVVGVDVEFVVYEDDAEREEGAIVQQLLAMGASAALFANNEIPLAAEPYRAPKLSHAALGFNAAVAYDPYAAPGQLPDASDVPYQLPFAPAAPGPRPDVIVESGDADPFGVLAHIAARQT